MSPGKLVDEKDVGCQDKSGPGKIHEVILVLTKNTVSNEGLHKLFPFVQKHCCNYFLHCFSAISQKLKLIILLIGLAMADLFSPLL